MSKKSPEKDPGSGTLQTLMDALPDRGDRPALVAFREEGVETWSYADLADRARRLANGLAELGVRGGEPVAMLAPNRPEGIAACLAVIRAGGVIVPLDVQSGDKTLSHLLNDSGPRVIFTTKEEADRLERVDPGGHRKMVFLDAGEEEEGSWRRFLKESGGDLPKVGKDDPAALFYTSGTTGPHKGVPLSHANLTFQLETLRESGLTVPSDRVLLPLPLHHVYPFVVGMLTPLAIGLTIILPRSLTGPELIRALREGEVTLIIGVPRLYRALFSGIEARFESRGRAAAALFRAGISLSTRLRPPLGVPIGKLLFRPLHRRVGPAVRVLASGGSALDPCLARKLEGLGWKVAIGYGLTETAPLLSLKLPGDAGRGSVGRPIPGVEIRISPAPPDRDVPSAPGDPLTPPAGEPGEIQARGPNVFPGYRNLPEETRRAFTPDGWLRTGDLGYFGARGHLFVLGRASTLIVTEGGENVQPEDVEEAYQEDPVIREIGVLQSEGRLVGVIVPDLREIRRRGEVRTEDAVREAVRGTSRRLPSYRRLADSVIRRHPLPRTPLGKIRRHLLADLYDREKSREEKPGKGAAGPVPTEDMSEEDRRLLRHPAARKVWEWLPGRFPDQRLTPDTSPQLDLGVDSLGWVNLSLDIGEVAGVDLSEEAIWRVETIRDLLREVADASGAGREGAPASPLEEPEAFLNERQKRWLRPLGPVMSGLSSLLFALNWILMRALFRLRVEGLEGLPDRTPFLLTPNHASHLDPFAIAAALGHRMLRRTYWAGWTGTLFRNPLLRLLSRLGRVVPIDPDRGVISSLAYGAAVLKGEMNLVVFPEGERSPTGELLPFKPGAGMLLKHFRVPVLPVFLQGTHAALPPGRVLPRLKPIRISLGPPLDPRELEHQGEGGEPHDRIVRALHDWVAKLGAGS